MQTLDTANLGEVPQDFADMLPDEIKQLLELEREKNLQQVEKIGLAIAKKRDEAVKARQSSGIEEVWAEDEDAYIGVDDANRSEAKAYKPPSINGSFTTTRRSTTRSTVLLNITRPYVDAAASRIADMAMPTDDRNWSMKPTPVPELEARMKQAFDANTAPDPQVQQVMDEANKRAEAAEKRIEDWLVECQWHAEMRKVLEDCAKLGTGIMKGPTPARRRNIQFVNGQMQVEYSFSPESKRIDPWNLYPDPACGESIHEGSFVFERDTLSTKQLRELKGVTGYLSEQIDKVLEEGPGKKYIEDRGVKKSVMDDDKFEVWFYYGLLDKDDLEALGVEADDSQLTGVPTICTLVNDAVIRAAMNPLDSGEFPYDVMPWQRVPNSWAGIGVGRQIRTPQRIITSATRNMMDNAGLSGGPIIILRKGMVEPVDGTWELTPRKIFVVKEEGDVRSVNDAIGSIIIPSNQPEMANIIQFALKMAEDVTGLPMILQGQQGQAPDTVGGMQLMQNNASTVLRRLARTLDDCITEPHIRRYYQWLMMYGEDAEKGDFRIDARGSAALVERDLQNQAILQMGQLVMNPAFGIDPEKWFAEACKAQRLDPKRFQMDEEKKAQLAQQQPPPPPQVMVAQIREQGAMQRKQMELAAGQQSDQLEAQIDMARIKTDIDRDAAYVMAETERTRAEHDGRMRELMLKRELALLEYANANKMTLDTIKADLAKESMRLNTQRELAAVSATAQRMSKPPTEPPGRAKPGQSWPQ